MKLRFTPSKETVLGIMNDRLVAEKALLAEEDAELAKLTATGPGNIYNPYQDRQEADLKAAIARRKAYIADREVELKIVDSHVAPRVLVDIDIQ